MFNTVFIIVGLWVVRKSGLEQKKNTIGLLGTKNHFLRWNSGTSNITY
jgi:hypothetical protein